MFCYFILSYYFFVITLIFDDWLFIETGAYALDSAIKVAHLNYKPLVNAIYFLESAIIIDEHASTSLLKNVGLGHIHLIQNKIIGKSLPKPKNDIFHSIEKIGWPIKDPE